MRNIGTKSPDKALCLGACPSPQSGRGIGRSGAGGSAGFARGRHPGGPDRARSRPGTPALPARDAELLTPATDAALPAPAPRGFAAPPAHRRDSAAAAWTVTALRLVVCGLGHGPKHRADKGRPCELPGSSSGTPGAPRRRSARSSRSVLPGRDQRGRRAPTGLLSRPPPSAHREARGQTGRPPGTSLVPVARARPAGRADC